MTNGSGRVSHIGKYPSQKHLTMYNLSDRREKYTTIFTDICSDVGVIIFRSLFSFCIGGRAFGRSSRFSCLNVEKGFFIDLSGFCCVIHLHIDFRMVDLYNRPKIGFRNQILFCTPRNLPALVRGLIFATKTPYSRHQDWRKRNWSTYYEAHFNVKIEGCGLHVKNIDVCW
jgi:hypothetical protein